MKKVCVLVLLTLLGAAHVYADTQDTVVFRTRMLPDNEIPPIAAAGNSANATITVHVSRDDRGNVNAATVTFDIDYTISSALTFTGLHIHNAPTGQNGAIVIDTGITGTNSVSRRIRQDHPCRELREHGHKWVAIRNRPSGDSRKLLREHPHDGAAEWVHARTVSGQQTGLSSRHEHLV